MPKLPIISVLMPVYNGEKYLNEAIDSILNQTFTDFEFIILNDGSTDRTKEIILSYDDPRIIYVNNIRNLKIATTLNKGLELARGKYIVRMDADDVSMRQRLAIQIDYMQSHPEITVCGSNLQVYEHPDQIWKLPLNNEAIKVRLLFECSFYHPTVIFKKKDIYDIKGGYNPFFSGAEDYELWQRLSESSIIHFANLAEPLLIYRSHPSESRYDYKIKQLKLSCAISSKNIKRLQIDLNENDLLLHEQVSRQYMPPDKIDLEGCHLWLKKIAKANNKQKLFLPHFLTQELKDRWLKICLLKSFSDPTVVCAFIKSDFAPISFNSLYQMIRMLWRSRMVLKK